MKFFNRLSKLLFPCALMMTASTALAQINLAGVYEANVSRKQIYLSADFINGTKDFTQVFSGKTASFQTLPEDFMNAKKLKKNFQGTTAPAFARYKEKTLFTLTEELRITNPVLTDGVLTADWESTDRKKGKCYIIVMPDRSMRILGLTGLERSLSPDDVTLALVEDRLPAGATPYITPQDKYDFIMDEYKRKFLNPPSCDSRNGIPGVKVAIAPERIRRCGNDIVFYPVWTNRNTKECTISVDGNPFDTNTYAAIDGDGSYSANMDKYTFNLPTGNEAVANFMYISKVPLTAKMITSLKVTGRAPSSPKSTTQNPYGKFDYIFTNIPIPELPESNIPGCVFTDSEIILEILSVEKAGKDLVVEFTLLNNGKKDKIFYADNFGKGSARTTDGEELKSQTSLPESLPAGEKAKGRLVVAGGATEQFSTIRQSFSIRERGMNYDSQLILRNLPQK